MKEKSEYNLKLRWSWSAIRNTIYKKAVTIVHRQFCVRKSIMIPIIIQPLSKLRFRSDKWKQILFAYHSKRQFNRSHGRLKTDPISGGGWQDNKSLQKQHRSSEDGCWLSSCVRHLVRFSIALLRFPIFVAIRCTIILSKEATTDDESQELKDRSKSWKSR